MKENWIINSQPIVAATEHKSGDLHITINDTTISLSIAPVSEYMALITLRDTTMPVYYARTRESFLVFVNGKVLEIQRQREEHSSVTSESGAASPADNTIEAPMPGKILKILVTEGQRVKADERLFILEAMKMENEVVAPRDGTVKKIFFKENDLVSLGQVIMELDYSE